ncbi:MAG: hypothetical protein HY054_14960 [Proteobacteria bacterium]|nr:hypothetical protein [Pseudomonadota bacterium]
MRFLQIGFGVVIAALGLMMLVIAFRTADAPGATPGQGLLGPLSLIGVGALAISVARKRKR